MIDAKIAIHQTPARQNDLVACRLLKTLDKEGQYALMYAQDSALLARIFDAAILNEEYEICAVITELLEERRASLKSFSSSTT